MKKIKNNLYVGFLSVALLMMLAACADGNSKSKNQPDENTVGDADSEKIKAEIEALQSELDALQAGQTETPTSQVDSLSEKLLDGEWFYQGDFNGGLERFVFYADGTGSLKVTNYTYSDSTIESSDPNYTGEDTYNFTWSLDSNIVQIMYDWSSSVVELTFLDNEQQLQLTREDSGVVVYAKIRPTIPEGLVEVASILGQQKVFQRKFLGKWHFDVFIWTFNEDGTGVIDVPAFGRYPAEKKEFTYTLLEDPYEMVDAIISIDLPDKGMFMYEATLGNQSGGSVTLQPRPEGGNPIMLTRSFDVRNSPITDEILDEGMALFEPFELFVKGRR